MKNTTHIILSVLLCGMVFSRADAQSVKYDVNDDRNVNTADVVSIYNYIIKGDAGEDKHHTVSIQVKGISVPMVPVEGGTFMMGATAELEHTSVLEAPAHQVTLSSYYIGRTEVTQDLWEAVMGKNPSSTKGTRLPVNNISWDDCQQFIQKLNEITGRKFRLPTEAEWEFAARGGNKSLHYKYCGSNDADEVAWHSGNSDIQIHNVGTKKANELGIYDMAGNVREWCQDWDGSYSSDAQTNPTGPSSGTNRVIRGSVYVLNSECCRPSYRGPMYPGNAQPYTGLRLALDL